MTDNTDLPNHIGKLIDEKLAPIKQDIGRVEQKVDAAHEFNKKAHDELVGMIVTSNDLNAQEQKQLAQRIERIEKHLGLSPLK